MTANPKTFVVYRRCSTAEQGDSGLGLEAQTAAARRYVESCGGMVLADYVEVESGRNPDRIELAKALAHARRSKATLLIGKLDRLSRNAAFLLTLMDSGVELTAADNPLVNRLTLQLLAVLAENEAVQISKRTKEALAAKKARGGLLGSARPGHWDGKEHIRRAAAAKGCLAAAVVNRRRKQDAYSDILPIIRQNRQDGMKLREIATALNEQGHTTRGGKQWTSTQVCRVLKIEDVA